MAILKSKISTDSVRFLENRDYMQVQIDDLRKRQDEISLGGPAPSREKHKSRGEIISTA
jgi:hypothetical protein